MTETSVGTFQSLQTLYVRLAAEVESATELTNGRELWVSKTGRTFWSPVKSGLRGRNNYWVKLYKPSEPKGEIVDPHVEVLSVYEPATNEVNEDVNFKIEAFEYSDGRSEFILHNGLYEGTLWSAPLDFQIAWTPLLSRAIDILLNIVH